MHILAPVNFLRFICAQCHIAETHTNKGLEAHARICAVPVLSVQLE